MLKPISIQDNVQQSPLSHKELAAIHRVHVQTIAKWKQRDTAEDRSSRPHTIHYALTALEKEVIAVVRKLT